MTQYKNLITEKSGNTCLITINRPDKLNALNRETLEEIAAAIAEVHSDNDIKGAIITGAGEKAFVAGADIAEIEAINPGKAEFFALKGQGIFAHIEKGTKPVIAAINGFALGGGCELAMACHIRVASENAKLGLPEVSLGIIPGYGGTQRLTHLTGKGKALEMMMTGEMITAQEAKEWGLVNHVVPQAELLNKAQEILNKIYSKAPYAIAQVIAAANAAEYSNGYDIEIKAFGNCCATEDFKEGTRAFLEKRKAEFKGR